MAFVIDFHGNPVDELEIYNLDAPRGSVWSTSTGVNASWIEIQPAENFSGYRGPCAFHIVVSGDTGAVVENASIKSASDLKLQGVINAMYHSDNKKNNNS